MSSVAAPLPASAHATDAVVRSVVHKFGGTSVADLERIKNAAQKVRREVERGYDVIVIVSAMSGKTNELVGWVEATSPMFDAREYDAVVASGEGQLEWVPGDAVTSRDLVEDLSTLIPKLLGLADDAPPFSAHYHYDDAGHLLIGFDD